MSTPGPGSSQTAQAKSPLPTADVEEDRLTQALISRGLITRDEIQVCATALEGERGAEPLLARLVKARLLTSGQAQRALQELSALLHEQIPGYQLLEKVGQGSMGTVYKARQLSMNRLVAIKMLHPRVAAKKELLNRLIREAHLAAKLSHNNIVQAIDVGHAGSLAYMVMEYVEGTTIKQELEEGKIYDEREALEIVIQMAQALQHAHRRGLVHRDVKPANIVLTPDGIAKLADLGMARETADEEMARAEKGMTIGTPFYIAPEQIHEGKAVDGRVDIYALGATLYHMVTGQPPFPGTKVDEVLKAHLEEHLTPPDHLNTSLSSGLGEVVEFMMAKDAQQRYHTADDLRIDLECLLAGQPPKLARERIESTTLAGLAKGELEHEEEDERREAVRGSDSATLWIAVLGTALGVSVLVNLFLLLRMR